MLKEINSWHLHDAMLANQHRMMW